MAPSALEEADEPAPAAIVRYVAPPAAIVAARPSPFRLAAADELGRRVVGGLVLLVPGVLVAGVLAYAGWRVLKSWRAWRAARTAAPAAKVEPAVIGVRIIDEVPAAKVEAAPRRRRARAPARRSA